jgi:phenylacetate-CoA ligase
MQVRVERAVDAAAADDGPLAERVAAEIRRKILVRCEVSIVPHGSLPRTERKSKRVFDERNGSAR